MDITIAEALPADFAAIAEINVSAYQEFAEHLSPEGWAMMAAKLRAVADRAQNTVFLVAHRGTELVGSVGYGPPGTGDPQIFPLEWATLHRLAVAPTHRGRGIGRRLIAACIGRARQDQVATMGLFTSDVMHSARPLYAQAGFRCESELPQPPHRLRYGRLVLTLI